MEKGHMKRKKCGKSQGLWGGLWAVTGLPCGMGLLQCLSEEISDMDEAKSFGKKLFKYLLFKQEMYDVIREIFVR